MVTLLRVHVVSFENPDTLMGGVEVHAVHLTRALIDLGVEATLVTRHPDEGKPPGTQWDIPVSWIKVPLPRGPLPPYHHRRLCLPAFHLGVRRRAEEADLIHGQAEAGMGALGKRPVVTTVHTDVLSEYETAKRPLPQGIPQRLLVGWDVTRWKRWARRVAGSIAVSPVVADRLVEDLGFEDPTVIPNGLPPFDVHDPGKARDRLGLPGGPLVLYLGRLADVKRVDRLIAAIPHLDEAIQVLVGGKGDRRADLEAQVEDLGVSETVDFLGFVPEDDKLALLTAADVLVLPSEHEGQPISLLEALGQGTPVVVSELGWLPEDLQPYATEAPVDQGPDRLADAIDQALDRGRLDGVPVPSWDDIAKRTIEVYDAAIDG